MPNKDDGVLSEWLNQNDGEDRIGVSASETLSPYDDEIDKFFGNINNLSDKFSSLTKKIVGQTIDQHKHFPLWWDSWNTKEEDEQLVDYYFNKPYQSRSSVEDLPVLLRSPFDFFNLFGESSRITPFGLFSYQAPSPHDYNTCMKKDGISLWDADGYWRCLFPNSNIPVQFLEYKKKQLAGQIVTKDDFEEKALAHSPSGNGAIDLGQQGIFFRHFDDFLKWKNIKYENEQSAYDRKHKELTKNYEENRFMNGPQNNDQNEKVLVGTSSKSTSSTEAGDIVLKEIKTKYYSDGTSVTNSILKRKPEGAKTWAIVEEKNEHGDKNLGWFWDSK